MKTSKTLSYFGMGMILIPPITYAAFGVGMKNYDNIMLLAGMTAIGAVIVNEIEKRLTTPKDT